MRRRGGEGARPWAWVVGLVMMGAACTFGLNPDEGRFSCEDDDDCGGGYVCRAQREGPGACYPEGTCAESDSCNGLDDDCDGAVDDDVPGLEPHCVAPEAVGRCAQGAQSCLDGAVACNPALPTIEQCNGEDDDCDTQTDEDFDLTNDPQHCGQCGRTCGAGAGCVASQCVESSCGDGLDNDGDGTVDCADDDCESRACATGTCTGGTCG